MTVEERGFGPGTDLLLRQVDGRLAALRAGLRGPDLELAEELARRLREMILATARSSAADRARVRAAVHYFVQRRESRDARLPLRSLAVAQRAVDRAARQLDSTALS
ncbi:hypothetical protein ACIODS_08410 [Micromonospora chalcea]|uniref:Uncharacterized protein n=1 Tax=Micromonospora chalcea TaxID=1874 RepID=A0ABX9YB43_MICCH|nr:MULTISPECIES: hypothetical protein [Micromonospora]EWM65311.1 hypothetical protein MCBG_02444 [Micromonospora sp. M42]MBC8994788.1 hypothetical protein [Micromonospora chalcea]MBQ1042245.1 hypothetical protein [Micromonospora sp. C72]MBQ1056219.1 hypothetical protein [Micromonospora sp. C32]MBQ1059929.1 hypothetical protein [Micromonospora sp. C41]